MQITLNKIGDIDVEVYETPDGEKLFYLESDSNNLESVLDYVENSLTKY